MCRTVKPVVIAAWMIASLVSPTPSQELDSERNFPSENSVVTLIRSVIETVLKEHIDPPTRQQMILDVIRGIANSNGTSSPLDLSNSISDAKGIDQNYELLATELEKLGVTSSPTKVFLRSLESALDKTVLGGVNFISRTAVLAEEQIAANRYVGIGVTLSLLEGQLKCPQFRGVFGDGPASEAGILVNDILESVDGMSTKDRTLEEVVQRLRGPADTSVILSVSSEGQPARDLKLFRRVVPIKSISLTEDDHEGALLIKVERIAASSLNELQKLVSNSEERGEPIRTIVLDLRNTSVDNLHNFHLFADGILDDATIGKVETRERVRTLNAEDGRAFGERRIVLLYSLGKSGPLDLLARACSEAGIAVYFSPQNSNAELQGLAISEPFTESIPVRGTDYNIEISTSRFLDRQGVALSAVPAGKDINRMKALLLDWDIFWGKNLAKKSEPQLIRIIRDLE